MKGTDHFRDLSIKEGNAQIDVCVDWVGSSGSVYVSVADTNALLNF